MNAFSFLFNHGNTYSHNFTHLTEQTFAYIHLKTLDRLKQRTKAMYKIASGSRALLAQLQKGDPNTRR